MAHYKLWRNREIGEAGGEAKMAQCSWRNKFAETTFPSTSEANSSCEKPADKTELPPNMRDSLARRFSDLWKEQPVPLGQINKVFASKWINNSSFVMGTKCNRLFAYDLVKKSLTQLPSLSSSDRRSPSFLEESCGIHAMDINPSGTMLATGGANPCDIAVYKLPSFEPSAIGEDAHREWIFDLRWLDDEFLVSGSRDSTIALWRFSENPAESITCSHVPWVKQLPIPYPAIAPVLVKPINTVEKIRGLAFNYKNKALSMISLNSSLCMLDIVTFQQIGFRRLTNCHECVCLTHNPEENTLALGCKSQFVLFDAKSFEPIVGIKLPTFDSTMGSSVLSAESYRTSRPLQTPSSVRSMSWAGSTITLGTGSGEILFFDIRNRKFVDCGCGRRSSLRIQGGWQNHDENYMEMYRWDRCPNAVYTHCYDQSGVRLLAAGGPITAAVEGNYAAVWS